ncbi:RNA polymerase-associated protein RTF1 homolog [Drosophila tropicalis]|uniref:RNA polymerase-associated protein RTF1 homolog n=1 Tax=Drosophila tropicalis TaxID=46794 RepID=UPI0035ABC5F8
MSDEYNLKKRKRLIIKAEALEDGEIIDNQSPEVELDTFSDGSHERHLGDGNDRYREGNINELSRENEIYHGNFGQDNLHREWGFNSHLDMKKISKEPYSTEFDIKQRSKVRRLNLDEQRAGNQRENAFGRLKAMRHNKLMTKQDPEKLKMKNIETPQQEPLRKVKLKASDIYSDDSSSSDFEVAQEHRLVSTLNELTRAVLTRNQLENFLDKPIFRETITNCFVRVNVGLPGVHSKQVYRISQIAGLERSKTEYPLGSQNTSFILKLRNAGQYVYSQMDVVSNRPVTQHEFDLWVCACRREGCPLPPLAVIEEKQKAIKEASNYSFTEREIDKMIQSKVKDGKKTASTAYQKVCLIMERDMAVDWNDLKTANRLEKKILTMEQNSEPEREQRVRPIGSPRTSHLPPVLPTKKSLAERQPKSNDIDLERYMRRKYKKSAVVSRTRVDAEECNEDSSVSVPSEEANKKGEDTVNDKEPKILNLYELNDFEVFLDISSLPPLNAILKDIKI